jgi:hypothetical protein
MRELAHVLLWTLIGTATLTGTLMIVVGMYEELPGIIRGTWSRSFKNRWRD